MKKRLALSWFVLVTLFGALQTGCGSSSASGSGSGNGSGSGSGSNGKTDPVFSQPCTDNVGVPFSSDLTDMSKILLINPPGLGTQLMRFRTFLWIDTSTTSTISIYTPTDADLVDGVYKSLNGLVDYDLHFLVNCTTWFLINHVASPLQAIKDVFPSQPQNTTANAPPLKNTIHFHAGDLVGYTTGTTDAHNWDFGVYDTTHVNVFANPTRYLHDGQYSKYITAVCPYDYFTKDKATYYAKFGETAPVSGAPCPNMSQDVIGALSGAWFDNSDSNSGAETIGLMIGRYVDNVVRISGVDGYTAQIQFGDSTYADPANVTTEHCYSANGQYYYFKVVSNQEMHLVTGTGACLTSFPATGYKSYYR